MNSRERYIATTQYEGRDRLYQWEMGPYEETVKRWQREGLPEDADWFAYGGYDDYVVAPVNVSLCPSFEYETLEETAEYEIYRDSRDGVIKEFTVQGGAYLETGATIAETSAKPTKVVSSMFSAVLGTLAFSALTMGFWIRKTNLIEWLVLAVATVLLYWPTLVTDAAGLLLVAAVWMSQKARNRRDEQAGAAATT